MPAVDFFIALFLYRTVSASPDRSFRADVLTMFRFFPDWRRFCVRGLILGWVILCAGVLVVGTGECRGGPLYQLQRLADLPDQAEVHALGINRLGEVAGYVVGSDGVGHAVAWKNDRARLLTELTAAEPFSRAFRINDAGQIVGNSRTASGAVHATLWDAEGGVRDLGTLTGEGDSFAADINELGVVAGSSQGAIGQNAFTWSAATGFVDYGNTDPPHRLAVAGFNGINNRGLMVGTSYFLLSPFHAAFAREGDRHVTELSPPGRNSLGMALAVNDEGTIVGYQNGDVGGPQGAIFRENGDFELLGTLGLEESLAQDVNSSGAIVGRAYSLVPGGGLITKAFVYLDGAMHDLLELSENSENWTLIEAAAINDGGAIVGRGFFDGKPTAFVAIPIPEPGGWTLGVICAAAGALYLRYGRRSVGGWVIA